jgi:phosphoribosylformylglycinamidine synthase
LAAAAVGRVTAEQVLRIDHRGEEIVAVPPYALADAPAYRPAAEEPADLSRQWSVAPPAPPAGDLSGMLLQLLASPDVASKRPVFRQYDHSVQVRTVLGPGEGDAAVLRIYEAAPRGVALTIAGSGRLCGLDPYRGARLAISECSAGLACVGAEPVGVTDCLNFGSPERPATFWAFRQAVSGLADACRALRIPVVGGNVSFYNESPSGPVPPTPVVAMVGFIEDVRRACGTAFRRTGEHVFLLEGAPPGLEGSAYLHLVHDLAAGRPADVDLAVHARVTDFVRTAVADGLLTSAHDCADGGAAVALAECAVAGECGVEATLPGVGRRDAMLFGEGPSRFILTASAESAGPLVERAAAQGVRIVAVGRTGGSRVRLRAGESGEVEAGPARWDVDLSLEELAGAYDALSEVFA